MVKIGPTLIGCLASGFNILRGDLSKKLRKKKLCLRSVERRKKQFLGKRNNNEGNHVGTHVTINICCKHGYQLLLANALPSFLFSTI